MTGIPLGRRIAVTLAALALSAVMFHGQVADALVTRGDDALRNADPSAGVRYYRRALAIDPQSSRAADRLAFSLSMRRGPGDAQAAIDVATAALMHRPGDVALLADRALAEQRLRHWPAAEQDFAAAGSAGHDPRYAHLAGRVALKLHDPRAARRYFELALQYAGAFGPARAALAGLR